MASLVRSGETVAAAASRRVAHPPVGDLASIDDPARLVPHVARHGVQFAVRELLTDDVGQKALALLPRLVETSEIIADLVTMQALAVANVEEVSGHLLTHLSGEGCIVPSIPTCRNARAEINLR